MPRARLPATRRRELILDAASRVFAEHGYAGASMAAIAAAAGIAPSVLYDHFPSKRDLHVALLETHARALVEHAARAVDAASPHELLRANVEAFFEFVERDPFAWRMLFREPAADPAIAAVHGRIQRETTVAIARLVALAPDVRLPEGMARERLDELVAETVKSTNNAIAAWWWEHREIRRETISALATDLLWSGLRTLLR